MTTLKDNASKHNSKKQEDAGDDNFIKPIIMQNKPVIICISF